MQEKARLLRTTLLLELAFLAPDVLAAVLARSLTVWADLLRCTTETVAVFLAGLTVRPTVLPAEDAVPVRVGLAILLDVGVVPVLAEGNMCERGHDALTPLGGAIMRSLRSAFLMTVVLFGAADAWGATDEETFLAVLKKFGVTDNGLSSKKPCLCVGGPADGQTGRLAVFRLGDRYHHEFDPQGSQMGSGSCLALGGAIEVLSK